MKKVLYLTVRRSVRCCWSPTGTSWQEPRAASCRPVPRHKDTLPPHPSPPYCGSFCLQPRQLRTHGDTTSVPRRASLLTAPSSWPPSFEAGSIWGFHEALLDCFLGHSSTLHPNLSRMGQRPFPSRAKVAHRTEGGAVGGGEGPRILSH